MPGQIPLTTSSFTYCVHMPLCFSSFSLYSLYQCLLEPLVQVPEMWPYLIHKSFPFSFQCTRSRSSNSVQFYNKSGGHTEKALEVNCHLHKDNSFSSIFVGYDLVLMLFGWDNWGWEVIQLHCQSQCVQAVCVLLLLIIYKPIYYISLYTI